MKQQQFFEPRSSKFVHKVLGDVAFSYDLCLSRLRDYWKRITNKNNSEKGLHYPFS